MASHWPPDGWRGAHRAANPQQIGLFQGSSGLAWRQLWGGVPATTRHENENTNHTVKAIGNVQEKDSKRHITLTHIEVKEL